MRGNTDHSGPGADATAILEGARRLRTKLNDNALNWRRGDVPCVYLRGRGTIVEVVNVSEREASCVEIGGPCRDRTCDHLIKSQRLKL